MATLKPVTGAGLNSKNKHAINANFKALNEEIAEGSGGSTGSSTTTLVTSAQILELNINPITLVPAPGVGKVNIIKRAKFEMKYSGLRYIGNTGLNIMFANDLTMMQLHVSGFTFLEKKDDTTYTALPMPGAMPQMQNQSLVLTVIGMSPTGGNSDITVTVYYETVELGYVPGEVTSLQLQNRISPPAAPEPSPSIPSDLQFWMLDIYNILIGGIRGTNVSPLRFDNLFQDNAGVFYGATGITITSSLGSIIGAYTVNSEGYLSFTYYPIDVGTDVISITFTDSYGRAVSKMVSLLVV